MGLGTPRNTVFIVGAGASVDFGFPIGSQLASQIRNKLDAEFAESMGREEKGPLRRALDAIGFHEGHRNAARQLRAGMGMGESIDQFLFRRRTDPMVRDLGMMAVADVILEAERASLLSKFDLDNYEQSLITLRQTLNGWPAILLDHVIGMLGPEEIGPELFSEISFVIFNYDRCVEQILFHHLHWRHNLAVDRAREIVRSIPMLHIYGVLGDPFDGPVPFGAASAELASVARGLQTYHEDITDADRQTKLNEMIARAEKVCFLGFGFLPENFSRLFPAGEIGGKQLAGTMMGCEGSSAFKLAFKSMGSCFASGNCTQFIRDFGADILYKPWNI